MQNMDRALELHVCVELEQGALFPSQAEVPPNSTSMSSSLVSLVSSMNFNVVLSKNSLEEPAILLYFSLRTNML